MELVYTLQQVLEKHSLHSAAAAALGMREDALNYSFYRTKLEELHSSVSPDRVEGLLVIVFSLLMANVMYEMLLFLLNWAAPYWRVRSMLGSIQKEEGTPKEGRTSGALLRALLNMSSRQIPLTLVDSERILSALGEQSQDGAVSLVVQNIGTASVQSQKKKDDKKKSNAKGKHNERSAEEGSPPSDPADGMQKREVVFFPAADYLCSSVPQPQKAKEPKASTRGQIHLLGLTGDSPAGPETGGISETSFNATKSMTILRSALFEDLMADDGNLLEGVPAWIRSVGVGSVHTVMDEDTMKLFLERLTEGAAKKNKNSNKNQNQGQEEVGRNPKKKAIDATDRTREKDSPSLVQVVSLSSSLELLMFPLKDKKKKGTTVEAYKPYRTTPFNTKETIVCCDPSECPILHVFVW